MRGDRAKEKETRGNRKQGEIKYDVKYERKKRQKMRQNEMRAEEMRGKETR